MPDLEEAFAVEFHHPAAPRQVAVVPEHAPGVEPDMRTVGQYVLALVVGRGDDVGFDLRAQVILHHDVVRSGGQQHDGGRGCDVAPDAADAEPLAAAHRLVKPFEFAFTASRLFGPESVPVVFQRPLLFIARGGVARPTPRSVRTSPGMSLPRKVSIMVFIRFTDITIFPVSPIRRFTRPLRTPER